jgi:NitT/TauT family transport system substrate-binding protein
MRNRPLIAVVGVLALALPAAGCGGSGGSTARPATGSTDNVAVGVIAIVDVAPIYLGKAKGFFAKRSINLTLKPGSGGAVTIPGVVSGQFQFGFGNVTSLLVARDKKLPLTVVANGISSTGKEGADFSAVVVRPDSPIRTPKDLAGHTVSVNNLNNIGDTTVRASVRKAGGDPATVKFVELALPDMTPALMKGRIDAAWVVEPFLTIAKNQGARPVAWNMVDAVPNLTVAAYFTTEKLIKDNPDLVKRFTDAMNESLDYAGTHPDEVREIVKTYTQIPADLIPKLTLPVWSSQLNRESIQQLAALVKQDGLVKNEPDVATLVP